MSAKTLRRRGGRKKNRSESLTAEIVEKVQNLTDSADVGGFASNFTKELARKTRRRPVDTRRLAERVESASREKRSGPIDIGGFSSNFTRALTRQAKSMSGAGQVEQERRASIATMRRRRGSISLGRTVPLGSRVDSVAHLTKRPESVAERELASRQLWNAAHDRNVKRAEQLIVVGGFDMDWVSPAKGTTALWELCRGALFECARLLLRVGDIKRWHGHARFHEEAHCTFAVPSTPLFLYIHSLTHIAPHPTLHRYIDGECTHKGAQGSGERYFGRAAYVGAQIYPQIITSRAPTQCKP